MRITHKILFVPALLLGLAGMFLAGGEARAAASQVTEDNLPQLLEKALREHPDIVLDVLRRNSEAVLDIAQQAMRDCDIEPVLKPIRGGTDGAQLSFMGLPCPNLFTGGYNYHGKHEFVTLEGMEKAVRVIVRIAELTAKQQ